MSWGVLLEESARLRSVPAPQHANLQVREPKMTTIAAPTTQTSAPDAPMDIAKPTAEPRRDLDVHMAERHPKRRRELEDVKMMAILAQPASERTCEICGVLVHADLADNNYLRGGAHGREDEREDQE